MFSMTTNDGKIIMLMTDNVAQSQNGTRSICGHRYCCSDRWYSCVTSSGRTEGRCSCSRCSCTWPSSGSDAFKLYFTYRLMITTSSRYLAQDYERLFTIAANDSIGIEDAYICCVRLCVLCLVLEMQPCVLCVVQVNFTT